MSIADLALRDLADVADAIAAGTVTSVQATEACLARIEAWQPRTNAFLRLKADKALAQARALDRELAAGDIIRFDVGGRYKHYRADIARKFGAGEVDVVSRLVATLNAEAGYVPAVGLVTPTTVTVAMRIPPILATG